MSDRYRWRRINFENIFLYHRRYPFWWPAIFSVHSTDLKKKQQNKFDNSNVAPAAAATVAVAVTAVDDDGSVFFFFANLKLNTK